MMMICLWVWTVFGVGTRIVEDDLCGRLTQSAHAACCQLFGNDAVQVCSGPRCVRVCIFLYSAQGRDRKLRGTWSGAEGGAAMTHI